MMRLPSRREWILLGLAALVVALSVAGTSRERAAVVEAIVAEGAGREPDRRHAARGPTAAEIDPARLQRHSDPREPANAFSSRSWYVPPPPPPPPPKVVPPPPSAPPLPFAYLGRYIDADVQTFFLVRGDRVITARAGDILDGLYRVDGVEGSSLVLTYLPLNTRQPIEVGSAG